MRRSKSILALAMVVAPALTAFQASPSAVDDSVIRNEGAAPLAIAVLTNDVDPLGGTKSIIGFTQPQFGAVAQSGSNLTYTAFSTTNRFAAIDAFTYTMTTTSGLSDSAVVYVDLRNLNPDAVNDSRTLPRNVPSFIYPRSNDTDPGGDALTITAITQPSSGSATFTPTTVTYQPPTGFAGTTSMTYTIGDGEGGADTATISITMDNSNTAPVAIDDNYGSISNNQQITFDVRLNDSDADGDPLIVTSVGPKTPNVGISGVAGGGTGVTYKAPASPFSGDVSFTYTISDGQGGTDTATFTVTVDNGA